MNDIEKNEDSWVRKLPKIIVLLAVLIFIIIVIRDHNQFIKWEENQTELTGKVDQTSEELALLRKANGSLQDVTKKVEALEQQATEITAALEKSNKEKSNTDATLAGLRQELRDLKKQVSVSKKEVTELTKEIETLKNTNQRLRDDILNKKNVLDSMAFLQKQKPILEQSIKDLKTRNDRAAKAWLEQQAEFEALQHKIKEEEAIIQAQKDQRTALINELSELTETVKTLSSQKEKLTMLDEHQKKLEYLEYLQLQKEALEISINSLLERGKILEEKNSKLLQSLPER